MTIGEAYIKFLEKINRNGTNDNAYADLGLFVSTFNEQQNKLIEYFLEKRNEDDILYVQKLLVLNKELERGVKHLEVQKFSLPKDYFSFSNVIAYASKGACKNQKIDLILVKSENFTKMNFDESNKPSFIFRETFYFLGSDEVNVFVDDFDLDNLYLTYYRKPRQVDIEGYIKSDNTNSINIDPELDDYFVDRVITLCVKAFNLNNDNLQRFSVDSTNSIEKV